MADIDLWGHVCDVPRAIVTDAENLDVPSALAGKGPFSLRWIMIHMMKKYARHNGHADLLREQIDGAVGE